MGFETLGSTARGTSAEGTAAGWSRSDAAGTNPLREAIFKPVGSF